MAFSAKMIGSFDAKIMPGAVYVPPSFRPINPINTDAYVEISHVRQASLLAKLSPRYDNPSFMLAAQADKKPAETISISQSHIPASAPSSQPERAPRITSFHSREEVRQFLKQSLKKSVEKNRDNFEKFNAARVLVLFGNHKEKLAGLNVLFKMTNSDDESYRLMAGRFLVLEGYRKIDENLRNEVAEGLLTSTNEKERRLGEKILIDLAFHARSEDVKIKSADILVAYTQVSRASMRMGIKALYKLAMSANKEERRYDAATMLVLSINGEAIKKGTAALRHLSNHANSHDIRLRAKKSLGEFQK